MKLPLKAADILIILLAICAVIFSTFSAFIKPQGASQIIIQGRESEWIFNIDKEEKITVTGPIGETVVRTAGGAVWVESSPCNNQNCTAAGFIRRQGQWAACLPNQVLIMIKSSGSKEVDAVSK